VQDLSPSLHSAFLIEVVIPTNKCPFSVPHGRTTKSAVPARVNTSLSSRGTNRRRIPCPYRPMSANMSYGGHAQGMEEPINA
jgi:hypothetical protein